MTRSMHRRPSERLPLVLIFAENLNDSRAVRELVLGLEPNLKQRFRIEVRRDPPSLTRQAQQGKVKTWIEQISSLVTTEIASGQSVRAVLVHQDADQFDKEGLRQRSLNQDLRRTITHCDSFAIVPVVMTESWWILHPAAVRATMPQAWRDLKLPSGDVERIPHPKKTLIQATKTASRSHPYSEVHSLAIAENIVRLNFPSAGECQSWANLTAVAHQLATN